MNKGQYIYMDPPKRLAEEKKDLTRKAIQKAAKKVFFEKGYLNTTIAEIAKLAGVAKGSIYLYFQTKDDLYLSLMLPILKEIQASMTTIYQSLSQGEIRSAQDFINRYLKHYLRIYHFDPDGIRIIQAFQLGDLISAMSEKNREELNQMAKENFQLSRRIFAKLIKDKLIAKRDYIQLSDTFWSTFIGVIQLEESKLRLTGKNHIEETLKTALSLLGKGLEPDKPA
ncbi:MAG: TetR/AcrR family transcriptional regulator [Thermodesulfobacteriota bacterium]